jgi:hypothetical protein
MKIFELSNTEEGAFYELEEVRSLTIDCVSHDDGEVNAENASDVLESCKTIEYKHLLQVRSKNSDKFYAVDADGKKLSDYPVITAMNMRPIEAFMNFYGNDTLLYHQLPDVDANGCEFDEWHPDHKI